MELLNQSTRHDWVVYAKRPFASPNCVLKYLRLHAPSRHLQSAILQLGEWQVSFRYKDYADDQQAKILRLSTAEFIRRFLMHTLPSLFIRIRYFVLFSNRNLTHSSKSVIVCSALLREPDVTKCPFDGKLAIFAERAYPHLDADRKAPAWPWATDLPACEAR